MTEKVTWVGKVDWELKKFHGDEYSTHHGSSYNSYLIRDTEKTVLVDTVWKPYDKEFVQNLKQEVELSQIDAIIVNHGEVDHSGALPLLMKEIPDTPIYCTANGVKSLTGQYHENWNFIPVKTGDTLDLGTVTLTFIEAPMLHWPDTMFTYMSGENILFSNDGFGQHYATESLYNDMVDPSELMAEARKYYANILCPFSMMVARKIREIQAMNLPLDMICTSHGVIWRNNPAQIVEKYLEWAADYQDNQVSIVYDTMWEATRHMGAGHRRWPAGGRPGRDGQAVQRLQVGQDRHHRRGLPVQGGGGGIPHSQQRLSVRHRRHSGADEGRQVQEEKGGRLRQLRLERRGREADKRGAGGLRLRGGQRGQTRLLGAR